MQAGIPTCRQCGAGRTTGPALRATCPNDLPDLAAARPSPPHEDPRDGRHAPHVHVTSLTSGQRERSTPFGGRAPPKQGTRPVVDGGNATTAPGLHRITVAPGAGSRRTLRDRVFG